MIPPFNFSRIPYIIFGNGKLLELYNFIPKFGKNILFIIGEKSLKESGKWDEIISTIKDKSINYSYLSISGEPSPNLIDENTAKFRNSSIDLVIGIGGGSVIDAGKAISAMIPKVHSIKDYLEGVGDKVHDGTKIPYIAIPTTSGTGSEATKNAVISEVGPNGFKKSLRHDNLVPNIAIIDPQLVLSCPPSVSAACGMDAFTQLLEAYVSSKANPMTDALAISGMKYIGANLLKASSNGASNMEVRAAMAYGSLLSGIALANAGLGIIHGLASPIGGFFNIPHGIVCGTLLAEATKMNIEKLKEKGSMGKIGLKKHAEIGALLNGKGYVEGDQIHKYCSKLIEILDKWTHELKLDRLGKYSIDTKDVEKIIEKAGLKNNPVNLSREEIKLIVTNRL
ncbi:MAG: iron-containing alcohol dehydrogenase [Candidatus Thorarchaeota archaeon]